MAVLQVQLQGAKDRVARVQASAKEETTELRQKLEKQREEVDLSLIHISEPTRH